MWCFFTRTYRNTTRMSLVEHYELLTEHYKMEGPFGGKVDLNHSKDKAGKLPAQYVKTSQFKTSGLAKYDLSKDLHERKDRTHETLEQRLERYTTRTEIGKERNSLVAQKGIRLRFGHLLEIVTHPKFIALAKEKLLLIKNLCQK